MIVRRVRRRPRHRLVPAHAAGPRARSRRRWTSRRGPRTSRARAARRAGSRARRASSTASCTRCRSACQRRNTQAGRDRAQVGHDWPGPRRSSPAPGHGPSDGSFARSSPAGWPRELRRPARPLPRGRAALDRARRRRPGCCSSTAAGCRRSTRGCCSCARREQVVAGRADEARLLPPADRQLARSVPLSVTIIEGEHGEFTRADRRGSSRSWSPATCASAATSSASRAASASSTQANEREKQRDRERAPRAPARAASTRTRRVGVRTATGRARWTPEPGRPPRPRRTRPGSREPRRGTARGDATAASTTCSRDRLTLMLNNAKDTFEDIWQWPWLELIRERPDAAGDPRPQARLQREPTERRQRAARARRTPDRARTARTRHQAGTPEYWWIEGDDTSCTRGRATAPTSSVRLRRRQPAAGRARPTRR